MNLPEWAEITGENRYGMPIVYIDAQAAYPTIIEEYREHYSKHIPASWKKNDGVLRKEWKECWENLNSEDLSAYWLEVVYQTIKLDIVRYMGFGTENRFMDAGKEYRQADRPEGRGADKAAGGFSGGTEARQHYKRLRGFLPT